MRSEADYRLHDQRHSYAVRASRAGTPAEVVARQLGHANAVLVLKVYGRFMPGQQDRDRWELIAAADDARRAEGLIRALEQLEDSGPEAGRPVYQTVYQKKERPIRQALDPATTRKSTTSHSRGGTRTRDPGIMSAVL